MRLTIKPKCRILQEEYSSRLVEQKEVNDERVFCIGYGMFCRVLLLSQASACFGWWNVGTFWLGRGRGTSGCWVLPSVPQRIQIKAV